MNAADVDFVVTHPEGYELDPKFVGNAKVEYDQKIMKYSSPYISVYALSIISGVTHCLILA